MAPLEPVEAKRKFFTAEEANKTLPLVRAIVGDVVRQFQVVEELRQRIRSVMAGRRKAVDEAYSDELAQSQAEMEAEEARLVEYVEELTRLGVELKGSDGLCDFPCLVDGREVYLCWRYGEPTISHWHELDTGFAGRQPLSTLHASGPSKHQGS